MSSSKTTRKRKLDIVEPNGDSGKRLRLSSNSQSDTELSNQPQVEQSLKLRRKKLDPPRPFPTVPTSVSATGPRSSHREGKNIICITRKTALGSYLRRCKDIIIKDGYKTIYFSAMGAAIPHLLHLVCALPPILPFPQDEIKWEVSTGTTAVNDELHPVDDNEDISYETRQKSNLTITFRIGDGQFEGDTGAVKKYSAGKFVGKNMQATGKPTQKSNQRAAYPDVIFEEPEQEFMDML